MPHQNWHRWGKPHPTLSTEGPRTIEETISQHLAGSLSGLDGLIVAGAVLLLFVISYTFGRQERDTEDFFLGGRRVPAVVACLSFVATEISALTIVGMPHKAFVEDWRWIQFLIGLALARLIVAFLFIPAFYKYKCTSIYEFLGHRFGPATQYTGSLYFLGNAPARPPACGSTSTCMAVGEHHGLAAGLDDCPVHRGQHPLHRLRRHQGGRLGRGV